MKDQKNLNKQIINIGPDEEFVTINKVAEICSNITGSNLNQFINQIDQEKLNTLLVLPKRHENYLNIKQQ